MLLSTKTLKAVKAVSVDRFTVEKTGGDGRVSRFDVSLYLGYEAFEELRDPNEFVKVSNGGYFVEWDCGVNLSADTTEARWQIVGKATPQTTA